MADSDLVCLQEVAEDEHGRRGEVVFAVPSKSSDDGSGGGSTYPTADGSAPSSDSSLDDPPLATESPMLPDRKGAAVPTTETSLPNGTVLTGTVAATTAAMPSAKTKTLCVLMSSTDGCEYDEHDPPADVEQHLRRGGVSGFQVETVFLAPGNCAKTLVELQRKWRNGEIDCFVNLCDGAWDEPSVGMEAVELLEHKLDVPFTGAGTDFFEPSRIDMKRAALACGVLVPAWRFVYTPEDLVDLLRDVERVTSDDGEEGAGPAGGPDPLPPLRFPLLVKHFSSYASVGLTKDSKVWNASDLAAQCHRMLASYGGCLVEEFIEGREFTVLAAEEPCDEIECDDLIRVVAYDPVECHFGPGEDFKHYHLKWVDYDAIGWRHVADADPELASRLKALARNVFRAVRGRGYGRLDVRSDPSGENLYFLEINPNCGIWYPEGYYGSADFILDQSDSHRAHADFLLKQVEVAHRHWRRRRNGRPCVARYEPQKRSWGMYAMRNLPEGAIVLHLEEKPFHLVSKAHVLREWGGPGELTATANTTTEQGDVHLRSWANFAAYCWPVSDDWFAMWSPNPSDWEPLNHSCDPNAWNEAPNGLNVVARRPIAAGEEITMDYATFVGCFPEMQSFECRCRSRDCRGLITGTDILRPDLAAKYRGHTSSYVAAKAREFHGSPPGGDTAAPPLVPDGGRRKADDPSSCAMLSV